LTRQQEALIGVSQFRTLPLTFLPMMTPALTREWVADAAWYNPVDWAATAGREALSADPDCVVCWVVTFTARNEDGA
jgi:ABC-2 type transport system permease protein